MGFAQVSAGEFGSELEAHGPRLRRYFLFASGRSEYPARRNDGCARNGSSQRTSVVCGYLIVWTAEDPRGGGHPARTQGAVRDSPAFLFAAESLGRRGPARRVG